MASLFLCLLYKSNTCNISVTIPLLNKLAEFIAQQHNKKEIQNMKLLTTLFATLFLIGTAQAEDANWNTSEHNYNINGDKWGLEVRTMGNDDYDHVEGSYKLTDSIELGLRYAEDGTDTEIRPKLTHSVFSAGPISLKHRIEYRYHEGVADDNWRYRGIVKAKLGNAWLAFVPRWEFGAGKTGDAKIDDIKWQAGYDWTLDADENSSVVFTPYVEYLQEGEEADWVKTHMILGTRLSVKF